MDLRVPPQVLAAPHVPPARAQRPRALKPGSPDLDAIANALEVPVKDKGVEQRRLLGCRQLGELALRQPLRGVAWMSSRIFKTRPHQACMLALSN